MSELPKIRSEINQVGSYTLPPINSLIQRVGQLAKKRSFSDISPPILSSKRQKQSTTKDKDWSQWVDPFIAKGKIENRKLLIEALGDCTVVKQLLVKERLLLLLAILKQDVKEINFCSTPFCSTPIDAATIAKVVDLCPNLTTLDFSGTSITWEAIYYLVELKHLTHLYLDNCYQITGQALMYVAKLKSLKTLSLVFKWKPTFEPSDLTKLRERGNLKLRNESIELVAKTGNHNPVSAP